MIIWGSKGRTKEVSRGQFYCPRCATLRPYVRRRVSKYFTLYFIPLFPTSTLGEYVECGACFTTFKPEVLEYAPNAWESPQRDPEVERALVRLSNALESGVPVQAAIQSLKDSGVDEKAAAIILFAATKGSVKICPACGAAYKDTLSFCGICGGRLTMAPRTG